LGGDHTLSLEMLVELPETVTVSFENVATDGDSLVTGTVTWEDSIIAEDVMSAEREIPSSREEGQLCFEEDDLFEEGCISLTPTSNVSEVQEISVKRKTVELSIGLDLPYGSPAETDVTVYEPFKADSTTFTGEGSFEVAKRKQGLTREIAADLVTEEPERSDHVDRLVADTTVSAFTSIELNLEFSKLAACNDGISNDGDELVDVWSDENGNGIPDKGDVGDPGCTDPEDDNEGHRFLTRVTTQLNDNVLISSAEGEREAVIDDHSSVNPLPATAQYSIGDFVVAVENKREADEAGEAFYLRFNTGPKDQLGNINSTQTVADSDTINGWHDAVVFGVDGSFWGDENHYTITAVFDGPTDSGETDIRFLNADGEGRKTVLSYLYEEEHYSGNSSKKATNGFRCRTTDGKRVCQKDSIGSYLSY